MARVIIPENPDELLDLMDETIEKEQALAPNGTLTAQELTDYIAFRDTAKLANKQQKEAYKKAEELTVTRNNALGIAEGMSVDQPGTGMFFLTSLRDLLLARNKTNPKKLGEWGFVVDDSPQPHKTSNNQPVPPPPPIPPVGP